MGPYEFTTLDAVKRYKWPQGDKGGADQVLSDLITRVTAEIKARLRRKLYQDNHTHQPDGRGYHSVWVPETPIASVTTLHDSIDQIFDASTLVAASDYVIDARSGCITRKAGVRFLDGVSNVKVAYVGGEPTLPPDIESVAIERVVTFYELRDALATSSIAHGDGSRTFLHGTEFTKSQLERMQPYMWESA